MHATRLHPGTPVSRRRTRSPATRGFLCSVLLGLVSIGACDRGPRAETQPTAGSQPVAHKHSRTVMGTFAELTAVARDRETARTAVEAGYERLDDVNRLMSDYVDDSEIGRLNQLTADQSLAVSPETFACLQQALDVAKGTSGAFDPTCRPLIALWRSAAKQGRLPADEELEDVLTRIGWQKLRLDPARRTATPTINGLQVDLGGIAKGYALDLAADAMKKRGAVGGLVNVGGDIVAFGARETGEPWRLGIQHPFQSTLFGTLALTDCAVATSGVQQRFFEIDGQRFSHIIDPRTGRPAEQAPSVTVIGPDGATADAWATVLSVLSPDEGRELLASDESPQLEVLWISGPPDNPTIHRTPGFDEHLASP